MSTLWNTLKQQAASSGQAFTVLAPMEDVTDTVFRQIVLSQGRPDLFMTEFTNCDGLASRGRDRVIHRLSYTPEQHPIVAQIWGRNIDTYVKAVPDLVSLGFDGIDINMGCPVPNVVKSGAGSGLIREPDKAEQIVLNVRQSLSESSRPDMGLSVKTRIGFTEIDYSWIEHVMTLPIDALTLHLRTTKELSKVPAHWEIMPKIIEMRDQLAPNLVIIGNGDVVQREQIATYRERYGVDGIMVGRGIFDNLWIFSQNDNGSGSTREKRIQLVIEHINLFRQTWTGQKNFEMIKKFFKIYLKNFDDAAVIRNKLMRLKTPEAMLAELDRIT